MTTLILAASRRITRTARRAGAWRLSVLVLPAVLAAGDPTAREIILVAMSEGYLQVSVFVAATLALVYGLERWLGIDTGVMLDRYRGWQIPVAAFLGALPGCGGAIVVVTQYVRGRLGFGAVVAVLTATMGDAAFLLLAREPLTGLAVVALGMAVGTLWGYVVERLHGADFLRRAPEIDAAEAASCRPGDHPRLRPLWLAIFVPGLAAGVLIALQVDADALLGAAAWQPTLWLGAAGALLAVSMWALLPMRKRALGAGDRCGHPAQGRGEVAGRMIADTNFITVWVIAAFLIYELGIHYSGVDLKTLFAVWAPVVPLMGVLLGFLPGCGPQIVVTTLYLSGVIPLSAQLGNALSNDGDALFPALALAPRAAIVATAYSAVPGLLVAYAYFWMWE
jgi:hypothetical protein